MSKEFNLSSKLPFLSFISEHSSHPLIFSFPSSGASLRLIFADGTIKCPELTPEAINVCKLLAIDPNDVIERDKSEFNVPGFTEKR